MYSKIVMVVDCGIEGEIASEYALFISKVCKATLYLCYHDMRDEILCTLSNIYGNAIKKGIETEKIFIEGDMVRGINSIIRGKKSLVTITLKGERYGRFFIGTLAQRLMKRAKSSVIGIRVVKARPITHHKRFLVPISNREYHTNERLFIIKEFAKNLGLRTVLFRCIKIKKDKEFTKRELRTLIKKNEIYLEPLKEHLEKESVFVDTRIRTCANATDTILDEAMARHFDLILVRAIKRNILKDFFWGNEMEEIIRRAPCTMLLWRSRG